MSAAVKFEKKLHIRLATSVFGSGYMFGPFVIDFWVR